ncbi:MAG: NAD-dependent deacylase [Planctomycetota bacterium]
MKPRVVALTGAGMSAESGLKTFRADDGLWEEHRVEDVATPEAFQRDPELVLRFYNQRRRQVVAAQPNTAHLALAELEQDFQVDVITQNIDDLHERAGSSAVLHLHGEILKMRSVLDDARLFPTLGQGIALGDLAPDGGQLRPHVVWFGEAVPALQAAAQVVGQADVLLIVGTSLAVYPAASLMHFAPPSTMRFLVDPNAEALGVQDVEVFAQAASTGVPQVIQALRQKFQL